MDSADISYLAKCGFIIGEKYCVELDNGKTVIGKLVGSLTEAWSALVFETIDQKNYQTVQCHVIWNKISAYYQLPKENPKENPTITNVD